MDATAYFRGKKITVMGLGLLGRGVGDAAYLAGCGAELIVTDRKSREELASSVVQLEGYPNVSFTLGEHRLEDFRDRDLILKAAGVPLDSPYIAEAKKHGIPVRMSADLFAELSGATILGITGTRGKSTVTHLAHAVLREAGKPVLLGGNVRGVSTLALLPQADAGTITVLELDSWQLQGWGEAKMSPQVAVFTTFFPDHLNYYKSDLDAYLSDKANIFLFQKPGDTLILGDQVAPIIEDRYGKSVLARATIAGGATVPGEWRLRMLGSHNRYNAGVALSAVRALGIPDEVSRRAMEAFAGVAGRLELISEKGGVKVYNDTTSTTPEATLAALEALPAPVTLIMGGTDKNLDMSELVSSVPAYTNRVIFLAGSGTDRVRGEFPEAPVYDSLEEAVKDAFAHAKSGDTILFSPAFTSFGMFKNEYDRGAQFDRLVHEH